MASPEELAALVLRTIKRALAPVLARLDGVEARPVVELAPLLERLAAAEARLAVADRTLDHASARLVALEASPRPEPLGPVREALAGIEARLVSLLSLPETVAVVRERVAALDARPLVPGPPGPAGADGADGLGFEDVAVDFDDAHTATIRFTAGDRVKAFPLVFPFLRYRQIFQEGTTYEPGDAVTYAGALWQCNKATKTRPGLITSAAEWTMAVKSGRDGKDGKPGERGPAGPAGKDWQQVYDAMRGT
jgi:hypothetical protein